TNTQTLKLKTDGANGPNNRSGLCWNGQVPSALMPRVAQRGMNMDANSGAPWSEMDIIDLTRSFDSGETFARTAGFLCRDEDEVRQKARQLGLVKHPGRNLAVGGRR